MRVSLIRYSVLGLMMLVLVGCGSSKSYVAEDKSTEYKKARSLPPLKKPKIVNETGNQQSQAAVPLTGVDAELVSLSNNKSRIKLHAGLDRAWKELGQRLKVANLTAYHRNLNLAQYAISCNGIDDSIYSQSAKKKTGKVPFLKKQKQMQEYCALQVTEKGPVSFVSVLDRYGEEVSADKSKSVLQQLIDIK